MDDMHTKDLKPLSEGEIVTGPKLWKLGNKTVTKDEWEWVEDEAYATPRAMLTGLLLGTMAWGIFFAVLYFLGWIG